MYETAGVLYSGTYLEEPISDVIVSGINELHAFDRRYDSRYEYSDAALSFIVHFKIDEFKLLTELDDTYRNLARDCSYVFNEGFCEIVFQEPERIVVFEEGDTIVIMLKPRIGHGEYKLVYWDSICGVLDTDSFRDYEIEI